MKKVFLTFSNTALKQKKSFGLKQFIHIIEKDCNLSIGYKWFEKEINKTPKDIHSKVLQAIQNSDIFIAEITYPSVGIGQQITYALQKRIPVFVCINSKAENQNLFLKGTKSRLMTIITYNDINDLKQKLSYKIRETTNYHFRLEKFNFLVTTKLKQSLKTASRKRGFSQSELLRQILEEWIENQEK